RTTIEKEPSSSLMARRVASNKPPPRCTCSSIRCEMTSVSVSEAISLHVLIDQVRDDLGVGLRGHLPAATLERGAQLEVVLDDAVVDDHHLAGAVRMRVLLRGPAMRRPARVTDAGRARERLLAQERRQVVELADAAAHLDTVVG